LNVGKPTYIGFHKLSPELLLTACFPVSFKHYITIED
jgi:hypothetical protein